MKPTKINTIGKTFIYIFIMMALSTWTGPLILIEKIAFAQTLPLLPATNPRDPVPTVAEDTSNGTPSEPTPTKTTEQRIKDFKADPANDWADVQHILNLFSSPEYVETTISVKKDCFPKELVDKYSVVVTTLEEPINILPPLNATELENYLKDPNITFFTQNCYRNTLQYSIKIFDPTVTEKVIAMESKTTTTLLTECDKDARKLQNDYLGKKHISVAFSCQPVELIISKGGTSLIFGYIGMIYAWGAGILGIISVAVIIYSGIEISVAGDGDALADAKKRITKSILGLVVLFMSGLILYTANPNFFVRNNITPVEKYCDSLQGQTRIVEQLKSGDKNYTNFPGTVTECENYLKTQK